MATNDNINSDILGTLLENEKPQEQVLHEINQTLRELASTMSQAEAENRRGSRRYSSSRDDSDNSDADRWRVNRNRRSRGGVQGAIDDFEEAFADQLQRALLGDTFADMVKGSLANFANSLGVSVDELGGSIGRMAANSIADAIQGGDGLGNRLFSGIRDARSNIADSFNNILNTASQNINPDAFVNSATDAAGAVENIANSGQMMGEVVSEVGAGGEALSQGLSTLAALPPQVSIAILAGLVVLDMWTEKIQESWQEVKKAATEFADSVDKAQDRVDNLLKMRLDSKITRLQKDYEAMITKSYDVMEQASQKMLDAWDQSLQKITATQGYDKAGMQDLLSNYAQRLRDEGLSSVVSTADLTTNLAQVLDAGLSGQVAEEFAYLATKLGAAIPTENFFQYASTYASVAANAIAAGKSQQAAIEYANAELEQFASNLLYSSRELAGGFSTGLKDASNLFSEAVKIATSSRTGNASEISGVLTAVSAAVGAVAPDLASNLVNNVVEAALGGNNNSALPALRSLSGVGASNTAFLNALATDAQSVFETLFRNLSDLQHMSADNYMEVAEGLSEVFGVSKEAFARVDFNYLADVISAMTISDDALDQNMALLVSGQTTYTAEQARIAEINKVMIEEGLAYVLDNEVARSIQENMWEEQRFNDLKETEFAVNIQGTALKLIQTIADLVESILDFLNPLSWMKDGVELINTMADSAYRQQEIEQLLKATVVGSGNEMSYYNLTHRGTDLNLTQSYLERLGVEGPHTVASAIRSATGSAINAFGAIDLLTGRSYTAEARNLFGELGTSLGQSGGIGGYLGSALMGGLYDAATSAASGVSNAVKSAYNWSLVGKSAAYSTLAASTRSAPYSALSVETAQSAMTTASQRNLQELLDSMQGYVDNQKSFSDWEQSATKYGIVDLEQALSDFGITMEDVKGQFLDLETQAGISYQHDLVEKEQEFWDASITWYTDTYPSDLENMTDLLLDLHEELMGQLIKSHRQLQDFYDQWVDYYVNHTAYSQETLNAYNVAAIRTAERQEVGDSVLALAEALTSTSIDLKDPAVQTNVLLAKILIITEAIMQQTNDTTTVSLPTALSALGLGYATETPRPNL